MNTEEFCGIKIFEWEEWDDISVGILQYYNVKFLFSSMKQYDGNIVSMNIDGQMIIYNDPIKIIWKGYKFAAKTHMLACGMKAASL